MILSSEKTNICVMQCMDNQSHEPGVNFFQFLTKTNCHDKTKKPSSNKIH